MNTRKQLFQSIKVIVLALVLSVGFNFVYAWTGPSSTPFNDNVPAPINVGSDQQAKAGKLILGAGLDVHGGVVNSYKQIVTGTWFSAGQMITSPDITAHKQGQVKGKFCLDLDCITSWSDVLPTGIKDGTLRFDKPTQTDPGEWVAEGNLINNGLEVSVKRDSGPANNIFSAWSTSPTKSAKGLYVKNTGDVGISGGLDVSGAVSTLGGATIIGDVNIGSSSNKKIVTINGEVTVNGKDVCLEDGTNCLGSGQVIAPDGYLIKMSSNNTLAGSILQESGTKVFLGDGQQFAIKKIRESIIHEGRLSWFSDGNFGLAVNQSPLLGWNGDSNNTKAVLYKDLEARGSIYLNQGENLHAGYYTRQGSECINTKCSVSCYSNTGEYVVGGGCQITGSFGELKSSYPDPINKTKWNCETNKVTSIIPSAICLRVR